MNQAERPLILAGGGARRAEPALRSLAELLDAPMVTTANGRGLLHRHRLNVPASPSLKAVRALMADADLVIAVGTEFGPTDYDMYADGGFVLPRGALGSQNLEEFLRSISRHANDAATLNELPILFRAVATDLETGRPVVLADVPLSVAMRASMSSAQASVHAGWSPQDAQR